MYVYTVVCMCMFDTRLDCQCTPKKRCLNSLLIGDGASKSNMFVCLITCPLARSGFSETHAGSSLFFFSVLNHSLWPYGSMATVREGIS